MQKVRNFGVFDLKWDVCIIFLSSRLRKEEKISVGGKEDYKSQRQWIIQRKQCLQETIEHVRTYIDYDSINKICINSIHRKF